MFVSTSPQVNSFVRFLVRALVSIALLAGFASAQGLVPKFVLAVNYAGNNVSVFRVQPLTGQLTPVPNSPFTVPGIAPWGVAVSPNGKFVYVGTSYSGICAFTLDQKTGGLTLVANYAVPGGAPDVTITPNGKFLYATATNGILEFAVNPSSGALHLIDGSPFDPKDTYIQVAVDPTTTYAFGLVWNSQNIYESWVQPMQILPSGQLMGAGVYVYTGVFPDDVKVDGSGRFVYVANWGDSTISGFSINPGSGALLSLPGSPYSEQISDPDSLAPIPNGRGVIVDDQGDDSMASLAINSDGSLTPVGSLQAVPSYPNAVVVDPTNEFVYSANTNSNSVTAYRLDAAYGTLQPIAGGLYINGWDPNQIAAVAGTNPPYCPLNTLDPSVTLCAPRTSTTSPMRVVSGSTDFASPVQTMQISIDGVATFKQSGWSAIDMYAVAPAGSHTLTIGTIDNYGRKFETSRLITIAGSTTAPCTDRGISPVVTICSPLPGANTGNSVHVVARSVGVSPIASTTVYLDGKEQYSVSGNAVDTYLDVSDGVHWIKVQSTDNIGSIWSASARVSAQ
jgi:6-phosphogluconolactonase